VLLVQRFAADPKGGTVRRRFTVALQDADGRIDHVAFEHGRPLAGRIGDKVGRMLDDSGRQPFALVDGIALIPIEGTLVHKGGMLGFTGHDLDAF
jgi:hypothetical protein